MLRDVADKLVRHFGLIPTWRVMPERIRLGEPDFFVGSSKLSFLSRSRALGTDPVEDLLTEFFAEI